ncbi:MAG: hypothetical protein HQ517_06690, partial [SAR324 cluster bacterium]|nr:hypothetical protein [SAR324 cluster bacterium]
MARYDYYQEEIYKISDVIETLKNQLTKNQLTNGNDAANLTVSVTVYNSFNRCATTLNLDKPEKLRGWEKWADDAIAKKAKSYNDKKGEEYNASRKLFGWTLGRSLDEDLHYNLLNLFCNYPQNPHLTIDGLIRRALPSFTRQKKRIDYAYVDLLLDDRQRYDFTKFPWIKARLFHQDGLETKDVYGIIACQESLVDYESYGNSDWFRDIQVEVKCGLSKEFEEIETYYQKFLDPLFSDDDTNMRFPSETKKNFEGARYSIAIPFYDAWIDGRSCGVMKGCFMVTPFEGDYTFEKRQRFIQENHNTITNWSLALSHTLFDSQA